MEVASMLKFRLCKHRALSRRIEKGNEVRVLTSHQLCEREAKTGSLYIYVSDLLPRVAVLFEPPLVLIRVCTMIIAIDRKRSLDVVLSTTTVT
jgi:hypothetical protein